MFAEAVIFVAVLANVAVSALPVKLPVTQVVVNISEYRSYVNSVSVFIPCVPVASLNKVKLIFSSV